MDKPIHILLPTDFSQESVLAINIAKQISAFMPVELSMLYVTSLNSISLHGTGSTFMDTGTIQATYLKEIREQGYAALKKQAEEQAIQPIHSEVIVEDVSTGIAEYAEEQKVDLILMGTKQAKGLLAWLSGSDAQVVARLSTVPLLTVMHGTELLHIDRMLFLHDCKKNPLAAPCDTMLRIQEACGAELHVIYVDSQAGDNGLAYVEHYIKNHDLQNAIPHAYISKDLKNFLSQFEKEKYDILCMGTHGRSQISQLFKKSVTEYMIAHSGIPVLSYRL